MKKNILNVLGWVAVFYLMGFLYVMACVAQGYTGGDMLTEHYRSVLMFIFN
jgi:hypothetical protein